ncbi:MAG TPA: hypothetical protein VNJ02_12990 [Vicinamibacterales bacterium]|nr:hypothetical protein [Vicinamibacterales bacterium]
MDTTTVASTSAYRYEFYAADGSRCCASDRRTTPTCGMCKARTVDIAHLPTPIALQEKNIMKNDTVPLDSITDVYAHIRALRSAPLPQTPPRDAANGVPEVPDLFAQIRAAHGALQGGVR